MADQQSTSTDETLAGLDEDNADLSLAITQSYHIIS